MVQRDVASIWESIDKPSHLTDAPLDRLFDLQITALPHFVFQKSEFTEAVGGVRARIDTLPLALTPSRSH